jgi:hypothetical protein
VTLPGSVRGLLFATVAAMLLAGCAADREREVLFAELEIATTAGGARHQAHWIRRDIEARSDLASDVRTELLADCERIETRSDALSAAMEATVAKVTDAQLAAMQMEAAALEAERERLAAKYPPIASQAD